MAVALVPASTGVAAGFDGHTGSSCKLEWGKQLKPFSQLSSFTLEALWGKRRRGETRNTDWGTRELALCFGVCGGVPAAAVPLGPLKTYSTRRCCFRFLGKHRGQHVGSAGHPGWAALCNAPAPSGNGEGLGLLAARGGS